MDWHNKKFVKNIIMAMLVAILAAGTCLLYAYYRTENLADYKMQNSYSSSKQVDSIASYDMRAVVKKEIDSIKKASGGDSQSSYDIQVNPVAKQLVSPKLAQVSLYQKDSLGSNETKGRKASNILQGPLAVFSHDYSIDIGKTVPVNISWEGSDTKAITCKLITLKVNDIAEQKVKFTVEDPFNVLLFSQTGYGAKDQIVINDSRHNITISVLQVSANSALVNVTSHLDESMVSKLQKIE